MPHGRNYLNSMAGKQQKTFDFMARVHETLQAHAMLSPGDRVLVGVSGGPDSVALLGVLNDMARQMSLKIAVAHLNHCLRGKESDRDEAFVRNLADCHGLPLYVRQKDVALRAREKKKSIEDAARDVRYAFYRDLTSQYGYNRVALGHNSDDNAEQVLMNLLRGTGPRGLMGIPPTRDDWIVRPLIRISRQDILAFLAHRCQSFVLDSSNEDTRYLRNRVRHELIPCLMKDYNPEIKSALNRLSLLVSAEEVWMDDQIRAMMSEHLEPMNKDEVRCNRDVFSSLGLAPARRLIRGAIQAVKGDLKRITWGHIDDILRLLDTHTGGKSLDLPHGIRISLTKHWMYVTHSSRPLRHLGRLHTSSTG